MGLMDLFSPAWMADRISKEDKAIAAVEKISDQNKLFEIVSKAPLCKVRVAAVQRINDQKMLMDIAMTRLPENLEITYAEVGEAAAEKIRDEKLLGEIALSAPCYVTRKAAAKKINDQELLARVIKNGNHNAAHVAADRMNDQTIIEQILLTCGNDAVSEYALQILAHKITGSDAIRKIAVNAPSPAVRDIAAYKLDDTDTLLDILSGDNSRSVREKANLRLCSCLEEEPLTVRQREKLEQIFICEQENNVDLKFLWRFIQKDASCLRKISKNAKRSDIRANAFGELCRTFELDKLLSEYKEITCDPDSGFDPDLLKEEWKDAVSTMLRRIQNEPEILLQFVQDPEIDSYTALKCVDALFKQGTDKPERDPAAMQNKAISAYLEHIPQYLEKAQIPNLNEGYYLRDLARVIPADRREQYGFDIYYTDNSGLRFKGKTYSF